MIFDQKKYFVCCSKLWIPDIAKILSQKIQSEFELITTKERLNEVALLSERQTIFFPHWSHILKENVYRNHDCIMFHMTDLPYGRGGSPLQNLIIRGHRETKISAFLCDGGIDTGSIFLKKDLELHGKAQDIFVRAHLIMIEMIEEIINKKPELQIQEGLVTEFKRRTPDQSDLALAQDFNQIYDMIRMLDAEGYPKAFIKTPTGHFTFENAHVEGDEIVAQVRIKK